MGVEIHRHFQGSLELGHEGVDARRAYQAGHILESDHLGAERLHLLGFFYKIFVGKDLFIFRSAFRIDSVADCCVSYAAELIDHADGALDVVDIIESVEDTHHVETVLYSLGIETFQHAVGIRHVSEEVAATRKS